MRKVGSLLALLAAGSGGSVVAGQSFNVVVKDGDFYTGVGAVTLINNVAVNSSGQWIVEVDTDGPTTTDGALIKNGAVFLQEDQTLVGLSPGNLSSFDSVKLNNAGVFNGNVFLRNTGSTSTDSGVLWNDRVVVQEGFISTAPQFSANTPYIGWFETRINDNNQILTLSSVDDPAIASTVDRAIVRWNVSPAGALLSETVLIKEGDALPGMGGQLLVDTGTGPNTLAFNNAGSAIYLVDGDGATTSDSAIFVDNAFIVREGDPALVVPGRNWGSQASSRVALNNNGDRAFLGTLDSTDLTNDTIIVRNGAQIAREGSGLPAIGAFTFTSFGTSAPIELDDNGSILWFGDWNDPDTTRDTGLFLNDQLLVQEGVTIIDGMTLFSISGIEEGFRISNNGQFVIFEGQLTGPVGLIDAAILVTVPEPGALGLLGAAAVALRRRRRR